DWKTIFNSSDYAEIRTADHKRITSVSAYYYGKEIMNDLELEANVKMMAQSPKLLQIAEMFLDQLISDGKENTIIGKMIKQTIIDSGVTIAKIETVDNDFYCGDEVDYDEKCLKQCNGCNNPT